jgi:hypothetical protein
VISLIYIASLIRKHSNILSSDIKKFLLQKVFPHEFGIFYDCKIIQQVQSDFGNSGLSDLTNQVALTS